MGEQRQDTDVVVIGSGVAGALVARELARAGYQVTILEAGDQWERSRATERYHQAIEKNLQAPYENWPWLSDGKQAHHYLSPKSDASYHPLFLQGVGGTTWHWTGITPRFLPEDFEIHHRYGVGVDWPISYSDLESFYGLAEQALGVSGDSHNHHGSPRSVDYPMPAIPMTYGDQVLAKKLAAKGIQVAALPAARNSVFYDGRPACQGNNTCSPLCPIGASYSANTDIEKAVSLGAKLISRAVVYRFAIDQQHRIQSVSYKHPDGLTRTIKAKRFIVACNSIETPRLLLMAANEQCPNGVANASLQVGKNLMDHAIFVREFSMPEPVYIGRGPQSVSTLLTGRGGEFRKEYAAAKFFLGNDLNIHKLASDMLHDSGNWSHIMAHLRQQAIHRSAIGAEIEQLPEASNYVTLDWQHLDPLGLPLPQLHYQLGSYAQKGLQHWQAFVERAIDHLGAQGESSSLSLSSHHPAGTTRMGKSAKTSVVDAHCRSHEHDNLYVLGGSVFPSLGTANPTLTIAALSLRLANEIRQQDG